MLSPFDLPIAPYIRNADYADRQPWFVAERSTTDYLLFYVQKGPVFVLMSSATLAFEEGEFGLIQPNMPHAMRGDVHTVSPYVHFDIFYNAKREQAFSTRPSQTDLSEYADLMQPRLNDFPGYDLPIRFRPSMPDLFRVTLLRLIELWKKREPLRTLEAHLLVGKLTLRLLSDWAAARSSGLGESGALRWIPAYLSQHLSDPLRVAEMAKQANLSKSRFNVLFKEQFGMPPHRYLQRLRVAHACELMRGDQITLGGIAEACGFADLAHFTKAFKKEKGATPGVYRKAARLSPSL